jgi:hypothetical protein
MAAFICFATFLAFNSSFSAVIYCHNSVLLIMANLFLYIRTTEPQILKNIKNIALS